MQGNSINNIFKKIILESSEMVFLANDFYPYEIFYTNESFEENIGHSLKDKTLIQLGIDVNSFLFKEQILFEFEGSKYEFSFEQPQDNSSNYYLFYKGKTITTNGLPTQEELLQLLNDAQEAYVVAKPDGEVCFSNKKALSLFGFSQDEKLYHLRETGFLFSDRNLWREWLKLGKEQLKTASLVSGKENELILEINATPADLDNNELILLSFKDISDKVALEKNLEESSQFLKNLTDQVPGGLYQMVLDQEGKMSFSFLSKGIATILGMSPEEITSFSDISSAIAKVHPMDLGQVVMSSVSSAKTLQPWQCQFRVKRGDSEDYHWVLGAARPEVLSNGDMVWYGYLTDITAQKEFETQLDDSRKAAEKANQVKSEFLSMISHELRTPLNAISGSTYSLMQDNPQHHQKDALTTINFAVENLITMINDLLDFQKIEAGKLKIEKAPLLLDSLVNQIIQGLSFHAKDTKNTLALEMDEGLDILVNADKTRLAQVLNNLITNALKFTRDGKVEVKVKLIDKMDSRAKVYFQVKDSGIGIAPEDQERIFNDFDQVKPTFSTKYGGTGLGLSITRKLLNLMGSEIHLKSKVGEGSEFSFELELDVMNQPLSDPGKVGLIPSTISSLHLLLAEDNDVNALVLGKIIKKWGYSFERVHNGREAVEAVKKTDFDCILMDIQMPEMDGFEATAAIKKFSDLPVIALTAAAKLEIMDRINEYGFDGFVAKPIDASELLKVIREAILERNQSA
ncbi:ATP-binding protein [Algoriphagus halophytocola]|uniref:histidine kinase n=1 Tax=Algoriphagus halophytocola TaxID=2991499 RepID=A0ABY6MLK7_9BACT|nr:MULTISPECIES: ATP-binding protein [unclassified Algoriphagus]UZD24025.1 ATP-binding protein [Algoriphagus sp. TR-M5]WBL41397.1 ATP-binding protein [Algoriphagus sp. TR-M9]